MQAINIKVITREGDSEVADTIDIIDIAGCGDDSELDGLLGCDDYKVIDTDDEFSWIFNNSPSPEDWEWAWIEYFGGAYPLDPDVCEAAEEAGILPENVDEAYSGQYSSDEAFAEDLAEQIGSIDQNASWPYTCIDWEWAAREIMYDYEESRGFYFRTM